MATATDFHKAMLNLLIYYFGKYSKNSNFGKLLKPIDIEMVEIEETDNKAIDILNIDVATGKNLDIFAENVNIIRGASNDEELRRRIKIEIKANRSRGRIAEIEEIVKLIFGENSLNGFLEGWQQSFYNYEPASLIVKLSNLAENPINIPEITFERIAAGGVKIYYEIIANFETTGIVENDEEVTVQKVIFLHAGTFRISRTLGRRL